MLFKNSIRALLGLLLALSVGIAGCKTVQRQRPAFPLGLYEIHLLSPVYAPLNAQVDLGDVAPERLGTLQAGTASQETYARYGLEYPSVIVEAVVVRTADGKAVIQLKSSEPIHQTYLTLLVELNWPEGRLVREYTILWDRCSRGDEAVCDIYREPVTRRLP
jgi:pilus assembly protein FimV